MEMSYERLLQASARCPERPQILKCSTNAYAVIVSFLATRMVCNKCNQHQSLNTAIVHDRPDNHEGIAFDDYAVIVHDSTIPDSLVSFELPSWRNAKVTTWNISTDEVKKEQ